VEAIPARTAVPGASEPRASEPRASEPRASEPRASEPRASEDRGPRPRPSPQWLTETVLFATLNSTDGRYRLTVSRIAGGLLDCVY
jgi:hypothetical protein